MTFKGSKWPVRECIQRIQIFKQSYYNFQIFHKTKIFNNCQKLRNAEKNNTDSLLVKSQASFNSVLFPDSVLQIFLHSFFSLRHNIYFLSSKFDEYNAFEKVYKPYNKKKISFYLINKFLSVLIKSAKPTIELAYFIKMRLKVCMNKSGQRIKLVQKTTNFSDLHCKTYTYYISSWNIQT